MADKSRAGAVEGSVGKTYTGTGVLIDDAQPSIAVGVVDDGGHFSARSATGRFISGCEDFFHGSTTCPTCDGTGRVSRGESHFAADTIKCRTQRNNAVLIFLDFF